MNWNLKDTVRSALLIMVAVLCVLDILSMIYLRRQVGLLQQGNAILREESVRAGQYAEAQLQVTQQVVCKILNPGAQCCPPGGNK
jgi:hypothetical protein